MNIVIKKKSKNKPTKKIKEHSSCRLLIKAFTIFISKGCSIFIPNNIVPQISIILKLLMQNLNTNPIAFFIIFLLKKAKALSCYITKLSNLGPPIFIFIFYIKAVTTGFLDFMYDASSMSCIINLMLLIHSKSSCR